MHSQFTTILTLSQVLSLGTSILGSVLYFNFNESVNLLKTSKSNSSHGGFKIQDSALESLLMILNCSSLSWQKAKSINGDQ